jgi:hypothetical protein
MGKLKKDKTCVSCRNKFRKLYNQRCYHCSLKEIHRLPNRRSSTIEEALNKIYTIHVYGKKGCRPKANIYVPPILAGLKVKLVPIKKNG